MTADDLRTRAREAAEQSRDEVLGGPWNGLYDAHYIDGFERGYLAHAAQQPTREQVEALREYTLNDPDGPDGAFAAFVRLNDVLALWDGAGS